MAVRANPNPEQSPMANTMPCGFGELKRIRTYINRDKVSKPENIMNMNDAKDFPFSIRENPPMTPQTRITAVRRIMIPEIIS